MKQFIRRWLLGDTKEDFFRHRAAYFRTKGIRKKYHHLRCRQILKQYGADIPMETVLEGTLYLPHGLQGIFISKGAVIGDGCTLFQYSGVCSNTAEGSKHQGAPKLGKNVMVGTHGVILGGITIGNNVRIGAGCVVTQDVPDNATVVSSPPRIILHEQQRSNAFIGLTESGLEKIRKEVCKNEI